MYAIVDIETTGGYAYKEAITEIGIVLTDGKKIEKTFSTLVNPQRGIPPYIVALTGITNEMVMDAPTFAELAEEVHALLKDRVFIAHNVNFDYGFMKNSFEESSIDFRPKRLCTVRLSRKVIPGMNSYSLGKLTRQLNITHNNPHRALGDAEATASLFHLLLKKDKNGEIPKALKGNSHETILPANLPKETFIQLPHAPGVYYFHDAKGKIIYIGKARNLKKRVSSHFSGDKGRRQKQDFYREIYDITFQLTGSELIAYLLEDREIKHYWPRYNRAQKGRARLFGVYAYQDRNGNTRLGVNKVQNNYPSIITFPNQWEARTWMMNQVEKYGLNPTYCGLPEFYAGEDVASHEANLERCLAEVEDERPSFAIMGRGREPEEGSFVLVEKGTYKGYGYYPQDDQVSNIEEAANYLIAQKETGVIKGIISAHLEKSSKSKVVYFNA